MLSSCIIIACVLCSVKDIAHERAWLKTNIFDVQVNLNKCILIGYYIIVFLLVG